MSSFMTRHMRPQDVHDEITFAEYAQQSAGIPFPSGNKEWIILRKNLKQFFEQYPGANFRTLVEIVDWCRNRKRRLANAYSVPKMMRYAWAEGAISYDPARALEEQTDRYIHDALEVETDPEWRKRLIGCRGSVTRRGVARQWYSSRSGLLNAH